MGPAPSESPISGLTPPKFDDGSDRLAWREAIIDWCDNVSACAAGGDNKSKGVATCLALTLYRSLPTGIKEQVKQSVRSGEVILTPDEGATPKDQMTTVRKILDIVAKDTAVDRISRMVRLNTQVHKCVRKNGENIKTFIARFKIPSFAYLNVIRADYHSAESQIFAMTLMINAKLGEQIFSNTISTLINGSKLATNEKEVHVAIRKSRLEKMIKAFKGVNDGDESELQECVDVITAAVAAHDKSLDDSEAAQGFISLANALDVLESLSLEQNSLGDMTDKPANDLRVTSAMLGGSTDNGRHSGTRNGQYQGWNGRPKGGYGYNNNNKGRFQRPWKGRDEWRREAPDLRADIDRKRNERAPVSGSKNDERFAKRMRNDDDHNNGSNQGFR